MRSNFSLNNDDADRSGLLSIYVSKRFLMDRFAIACKVSHVLSLYICICVSMMVITYSKGKDQPVAPVAQLVSS